MFALEISEEICFFALFLAFFGKFLMIFKKIPCHSFSFFARTVPVLEYFKNYSKSLTIVLGLRKNMLRQKSNFGQKRQFEKSDFLGFMPKRCRYWISHCSIGTTQKYNQ